MVIPILTAPILGRLYTPSDYGMLGIFMGLSTIFSMIGNWQYSQAIVVQSRTRSAHCLLAVCIWATTATSAASLLATFIVTTFFFKESSLDVVLDWIWTVPLTTFCAGVSSALAAIANRQRQFGFMSIVSITSAVATTGVSVGLGILGTGASGLFLSYVVGQLSALLLYGWHQRTALRALGTFGMASVLKMARRNFAFARFSLPASLLRSVALTAPTFALGLMGSVDLAGHFSRAQSLLALPIGLVGMAVAQVFQESGARERALRGNCWGSYKRLLVALMIGSPPAFAIIALLAPKVFVMYLGAHWAGTGHIAQILAPMMCLRMISGPLWPVFSIMNGNHQDFWNAFWQCVATVTFSAVIVATSFAPIWQIVSFSVVNSAICLALIIQTCVLARAKPSKEVLVS